MIPVVNARIRFQGRVPTAGRCPGRRVLPVLYSFALESEIYPELRGLEMSVWTTLILTAAMTADNNPAGAVTAVGCQNTAGSGRQTVFVRPCSFSLYDVLQPEPASTESLCGGPLPAMPATGQSV